MASLKIDLNSTDATGAVITMTFYENNVASSSGTFKVDSKTPTYLELLTNSTLTLKGGSPSGP